MLEGNNQATCRVFRKKSSQLPSQEKYKWFSWSNLNFKAMLSYPLKFHRTVKRIGQSQTLLHVLEGPRDSKDEHFVESFREMLFLDGLLPPKHNDYHTLLRFLRMRDFDLIKAKEAFLNYLKWREEFGVDAIYKEFKFEERGDVKRCYAHGFHGVDRCGRPIYIERIGLVDLNALLQITSIERFLKYHISEQEKTLRWRFPSCSIAARNHIASTTTILDVKGVGMANFSKPARNLFMEIQKIDSNYYPETLHRLFVINAGSGFKVLWKVLRAFFEARTLAKIQVLGSNYRSKLLEVIDPSNLPSFMGGNCTCSEYGGCLSSDKGPWNDTEITELLQGIVDAEEDNRNGERSGVAAKEAVPSDIDNIQIKDVYDISPPEDTQLVDAKVVNMPVLKKLQAFEAALKDANMQIQTLEAWIKDTKVVLRGLDHRRIEFPFSNQNPISISNSIDFGQINLHSIEKMSTGELLNIEPVELKFPFELKKQISSSLQLSNKTDNHVAFKVKTTNPKKYCVRPNTGVVLPGSTCDVIVTMQAQKEAPSDMQCKDKFLLQSVVASTGASAKDITPEMFSKEAGHVVEECKLRVVYVSPPQPPSPVTEGSEEGSSPRTLHSENGNTSSSEVSRAFVDSHDKSSEVRALISKLTEEKSAAVQQSNKLRQELELMRRANVTKRQGGVSIMLVIIVGLLGIVLGYLMKKA